MKAIIAKKLGMTRIFDENGNVIVVTLLNVPENVVTAIRNTSSDGYDAAQIGLVENKKINKPLTGHLAKAETKTRTLKEFPITDMEVGQKIDLSVFEAGDVVTAQSISKGKGFAGTVKRHNFHTGPKTHGSHNYRQPGSIGATGPQRVIKGRRMAGHMGHDQITLKNIKVVNVDQDKKIMMVKGAIPGPNKSTVFIWSK